MAICRPGSPSSMNRAATSLIRVAPRVITTNWMTTRIKNRIAPTITLSPATNSPKARMTPPAASRPCSPPRVNTNLVVATLSTSRVSVVVKSTVGKALKSCGERIASVVSNTSTATVMLADWRKSRTSGGTGMMKTRIAPMIVAGNTAPASRERPVDWLGGVGGIRSPPRSLGISRDSAGTYRTS